MLVYVFDSCVVNVNVLMLADIEGRRGEEHSFIDFGRAMALHFIPLRSHQHPSVNDPMSSSSSGIEPGQGFAHLHRMCDKLEIDLLPTPWTAPSNHSTA